MADIEDIQKTPRSTLSKEMLDICQQVKGKRARTVIDHILEYGIITNEELKDKYGYGHQPRAVRDVRDAGIPVITHEVFSQKTGRRMGAYTFGDASNIVAGRIGGRKALPKKLKKLLLKMNGSRDAISHVVLPSSCLQIDHRIPYEISGDDGGVLDPSLFMLLDASSNRQKSWACEQCDNFLFFRSPEVCRQCYWASPEDYTHVAGTELRRVDIAWEGKETEIYDNLLQQAKRKGISVSKLIKIKLER